MSKVRNAGIIITTDDPETCHIAVSCAIFHLMQKEIVEIFFTDTGISWVKSNENNELLRKFKSDGGSVKLLADKKKLIGALKGFFKTLITEKGIEDIANDRRFRSLKTEHAYARKFNK